MHQTHQVVFLLFDGHLTAIFDATKSPQFLVLPIYVIFALQISLYVLLMHVQSFYMCLFIFRPVVCDPSIGISGIYREDDMRSKDGLATL